MIRRIAVLTGDNDAPGMNDLIRAITRSAIEQGWEVVGVCDGFSGLLDGDFIPLSVHAVDMMHQCATSMLGSTENGPFWVESTQHLALKQLTANEIDALVVVGGERTQMGASELAQLGFPVHGIAASVENELAGFDMVVGVDTAMNVCIDSIDELRMARPPLGTVFLVEVAGRRCGHLALVSGLASHADVIIIPEVETSLDQIAAVVHNLTKSGKVHPVIVVAEGADQDINRVRRRLEADAPPGPSLQMARVGFFQRRAAPSAYDRVLSARLGAGAVDALARGEQGVLVGMCQGATRTLPFAEVLGKPHQLDSGLLHLANLLSYCKFSETPAH